MPFRTGQIISKGFLFLALGLSVVFQFLPQGDGERGWSLWIGLKNVAVDAMGRDPEQLIGSGLLLLLAWYLTVPVLSVASPFLGRLWILSKLAWAAVTGLSGFMMLLPWVGYWSGKSGLAATDWPLLSASAANFIGLLFSRTGARELGTIINPQRDPLVRPMDGA